MKITKFGHCCLLIEENNVRILTDPGTYTVKQNEIDNVDVLLITHEHADHYHIDSVRKILERNPEITIITNSSVYTLLEKEGVSSVKIVEDGQNYEYKGITFRAIGKDHAVIYREWPIVQNTGYFIGERLFYPGDAFVEPKIPVDVLALPIAGPWLKISEVIDYAIAVSPKKTFPVHDGGLNPSGGGLMNRMLPQIFSKQGIEYIALPIEQETEI